MKRKPVSTPDIVHVWLILNRKNRLMIEVDDIRHSILEQSNTMAVKWGEKN